MLLNDAVNIGLRYIGETPVPPGVDIDTLNPLHEAVIIKDILQEVSEELQSQGWWFNKEEWTFQPDTSNHIGIPPDVLSLKVNGKDIIQRGGSLYDRENKTYLFTQPVTADVIWRWDFEDLPKTFASYVTYMGAKQAQVFLNGDEFVDRDLEKQIGYALIKVEKEHLRNSKYNLVKNTRVVDRGTVPKGTR